MPSYKIGDSFMHVPLSEAQDLLTEQTSEIEGEVSALQEELDGIKEEISGLKAHLYARFGRGINLEA
jgi:prefoldin subunit 4